MVVLLVIMVVVEVLVVLVISAVVVVVAAVVATAAVVAVVVVVVAVDVDGVVPTAADARCCHSNPSALAPTLTTASADTDHSERRLTD